MATQNTKTESTLLSADEKNRYWGYCDSYVVPPEIAAQLLIRQPNTLKKWRSDQIGPAYIKGKPPLYRIGDLKEYLDQMKR